MQGRVKHSGCSCFSHSGQGLHQSCIFRGVFLMHYRHQNQSSRLGNVITDFPGSVMALETTRRVCIKANHYGKTFVAIFKNWEQVSEYNTVKEHRSRRLCTSFLQNKCMFDDHNLVCGKSHRQEHLWMISEFWKKRRKIILLKFSNYLP